MTFLTIPTSENLHAPRYRHGHHFLHVDDPWGENFDDEKIDFPVTEKLDFSGVGVG